MQKFGTQSPGRKLRTMQAVGLAPTCRDWSPTVASGPAARRARLRVARNAAEARDEAAFQSWWRLDLDHHLQNRDKDALSGAARLEALRARIVARQSSVSI